MKNTNKKIILSYVLAGLLCLFLLLIYYEVKMIRSSIYDTFYANRVHFQAENSTVPNYKYRISFNLFSSQEKNYENNSLLVLFKCYDKNGSMIADDIEAKIRKGEFHQGYTSYVGTWGARYDEIEYCELNYVKVN